MLRPIDGAPSGAAAARAGTRQSTLYPIAKRIFDVVFSAVFLLPSIVFVAACLLTLNPIFNPGPLLYRAKRMGRDCRPIRVFKFRTMHPARNGETRGPDDPLEVERITALGAFVRRSRIDELPQILNVFRGEMSLIGPRPDDWHHACAFLADVPGYRHRHGVRPGISGLAQIELGYVHGREGAAAKTALDLQYIRSADLRLDAWILWQTIRTVIDLKGR